MAIDYADMLATSRELLDEFGQDGTLTKTTGGTYDETTGTVGSPTTTTTTDKCVVLEYAQGLTNMPDSLIKVGDNKILTQMSVVPTTADKFTANSIVYTIIGVKSLEPAGINLLYELHCRK
jgi:hypothetical protein